MSRFRTLLDERMSAGLDARGDSACTTASGGPRRGPRALVMGIINRTPDSFSDGGRFVADDAAASAVDRLLAEGADILDIGAESTRPAAPPIGDREQIARLGSVVRLAARAVEGIGGARLVSVDTTSPTVAAWALGEGATLVNSVSLEPAAELGALCARHGAALVLMHCRGAMSAMAGFSTYPDDAYADVCTDVAREWSVAAERALAAGLPAHDLVLDPGLGFAKNARQSLELCARLDELVALGFPVLVGPSRKSFVAIAATPEGEPLPPTADRLGGSLAVSLACVARGAAVVRVHDVAATRQALATADALDRSRERSARAPRGNAPVLPTQARHV